jgi:glycosyltransferase involved in cell wall biosynthesis
MAREARFISVIMPCREEECHIGKALRSILANDYPRHRLEVLVVDGMSTDGTRQVVAALAEEHPCVRLVDNPKQITPAALNVGIAQARGEVIIRVDAHSTYPPDYLSSLVAWQEHTGADNVGGVWRILPGSATPMARAIALGLAHPFGVGNAHYRIGTTAPRWVDTVPFGCYSREVFTRNGLFDEDHVRTEDDEFNLRLRKNGGRSLLVPEIIIDYYARESLSKIGRVYYYYGYFKPLVARKLGLVLGLRHIVPSLFITTLAAALLLGWWFPILGVLGLLVLVTYLLADVVCAWIAGRGQGPAVAACLALVFPALHFSYGLGFWKGLVDFCLLGRKGRRAGREVPLAR